MHASRPLLDKATALVELAKELRIGLSSVLFIDDNPGEVASVRAALPSVAAWCWPQEGARAALELQHVWQLDLALRRVLHKCVSAASPDLLRHV